MLTQSGLGSLRGTISAQPTIPDPVTGTTTMTSQTHEIPSVATSWALVQPLRRPRRRASQTPRSPRSVRPPGLRVCHSDPDQIAERQVRDLSCGSVRDCASGHAASDSESVYRGLDVGVAEGRLDPVDAFVDRRKAYLQRLAALLRDR